MSAGDDDELGRIRSAYARRGAVYDPLAPWVYLTRQERERRLIHWLRTAQIPPPEDCRLIELGCGLGGNLLDFLRLGFQPQNLCGNELIDARLAEARRLLPTDLPLLPGDAASIPCRDGSFDVVFQSMMCSSILDDRVLRQVVERMWALARPGGGVLWYDFIYDNPANRDVRGIPIRRIKSLFPASRPVVWRTTLAPPLSRRVTRVHPSLYGFCNLIPWLRTHVLCWLPKSSG